MISNDRRRRLRQPGLLVPLAALLLGAADGQRQYVRDDANMLSPQTVSSVQSRDRQLASDTGKWIQVVTTGTTNGTPIGEAAAQAARTLGVNGAIIFIAKDDRRFSIAYGRHTQQAFGPPTQTAIKNDMSSAFHSGDFDGGVISAVNAIADRMETRPAGAAAGNVPRAQSGAQAATSGGEQRGGG
ncbi:MAG: TPM domain-containing protein, partial [Candidatus Eremiobacteraeota bacterium]|nr:TPM domain-containing protein [Candidatus Eremiobacteraeota bacterium]